MNFGKICEIARHELNQKDEMLDGGVSGVSPPADKAGAGHVSASQRASAKVVSAGEGIAPADTTDRLAMAQNYLGKAQYELQQLKKESKR